MTGEHFNALAGKMAAGAQVDEATYRTAISRAYCGAFHLVREYLQTLQIRLNRDHGERQRSLMESGHPRAREAGSLLVDLHRGRIRADYDLGHQYVKTPTFTQECVEVASDIRTILRELDTDAQRQQIKAGIEAYRKRIGR